MKTRRRFIINLLEWNLLPVKWDYDNMGYGIEHRRYYFLCFKFETYKIIKKDE
jgi:hypothetical protein